MKKFYILFALTIPMWGLSAFAQEAPPTAQAPDWLVNFFASYPKLGVLIFVVGGLRLTLKPLFTFLHQSLPAWGLVSFDQSVTAVEVSKPMKALFFIMDYLGSVKMPVPQNKSGQSTPPTLPGS